MNNLNIKLALFKRAHSVAFDICAFCEKDLSRTAFKDWKSVDESLISALCQECQDETFEEVSDEIN